MLTVKDNDEKLFYNHERITDKQEDGKETFDFK